MTYLPDTDVCIGAMRGNPRIVSTISAHSPEDCAISSAYGSRTGIAVMLEIYAKACGAQKSR